jgi:hypothetical protein
MKMSPIREHAMLHGMYHQPRAPGPNAGNGAFRQHDTRQAKVDVRPATARGGSVNVRTKSRYDRVSRLSHDCPTGARHSSRLERTVRSEREAESDWVGVERLIVNAELQEVGK